MKLDRNVLSKLGKILVLGCGGKMGHHYMEKLLNLGINSYNIIGVDINLENLNKITARYPGPFYTANHDLALKKNPSVAIVSVNSTEHLKEIVRCYEAGITKIFCEKPLVYDFNELNDLRVYNNDHLITAYLINFSQIVMDLLDFVKNKNLIVTQIFSVWGKNWPGEKRVMGGDAEEEMMHPLALGDMIIRSLQSVEQVFVSSKMSMVPHVQPEYLSEMANLDVFFPEAMNDSTCAAYEYNTGAGKLWFFIISSFNLAEQQRWVEFSFNYPDDIDSSGIPKVPPRYKAHMYFDLRPVDVWRAISAFVNPKYFFNELDESIEEVIRMKPWRDVLRIKDARTNGILRKETSTVDKLQVMLKAALEAFAADQVDPRLVFFEQSAGLMHLVHQAIKSATEK